MKQITRIRVFRTKASARKGGLSYVRFQVPERGISRLAYRSKDDGWQYLLGTNMEVYGDGYGWFTVYCPFGETDIERVLHVINKYNRTADAIGGLYPHQEQAVNMVRNGPRSVVLDLPTVQDSVIPDPNKAVLTVPKHKKLLVKVSKGHTVNRAEQARRGFDMENSGAVSAPASSFQKHNSSTQGKTNESSKDVLINRSNRTASESRLAALANKFNARRN